MMHKIMYWLTGFLKCRIIKYNDGPYLERYYLGTIFGKRLFIHRFMASDPDRGLHDHPWEWALSLILSGGYDELIMYGKDIKVIKRRAFTINKFTGEKFHRVMLPDELVGKSWTLFIHGDRDRDWGFLNYYLDEDGHIGYTEFKKASTELERQKNKHWWQKADAKTGRELRQEI